MRLLLRLTLHRSLRQQFRRWSWCPRPLDRFHALFDHRCQSRHHIVSTCRVPVVEGCSGHQLLKLDVGSCRLVHCLVVRGDTFVLTNRVIVFCSLTLALFSFVPLGFAVSRSFRHARHAPSAAWTGVSFLGSVTSRVVARREQWDEARAVDDIFPVPAPPRSALPRSLPFSPRPHCIVIKSVVPLVPAEQPASLRLRPFASRQRTRELRNLLLLLLVVSLEQEQNGNP